MNKNKIGENSGQNDALKLFGIVAMTIDHIGYFLFPKIIIFRLIGRMAYPIFAWYLSQGYIHTSNLKKYALRLGLFALVAQLPYYFVFREIKLNIFFTLLAGLLAIHLFEKKKYVLLVALIALCGYLPVDYSYYGILVVLSFHIFRSKQIIFLAQEIVSFVGLYLFGILQPFSLVGVAVSLFYPKDFIRIRLNKYFFYAYYPIHLILIYLVGLMLNFSK